MTFKTTIIINKSWSTSVQETEYFNNTGAVTMHQKGLNTPSLVTPESTDEDLS